MPVNSINNFNTTHRMNQPFKANPADSKAQDKTSKTPDKPHKNSKLLFVPGALVLAGLGIYAVKKLHKSKNPISNPGGKLGEEINKVKDELTNKIDDTAEVIKEKAQNIVKKAVEKVDDAAAKKETVTEKVSEKVQEVIVKDMPKKAAPQSVTADLKEVAEDAVVVAEEAVKKTKAEITPEKKQALSGLVESLTPNAKKQSAEKNKKISGIVDSLKANASKIEASDNAVVAFNKSHAEEVKRILEENIHNFYVDVKTLEKVGRDFAADKNRPDNLKQAANLLENTYKRAYIESHPDRTKEGYVKVFKRITEESHDLFDIYAQMPREDALQRIRVFSRETLEVKGFRTLDWTVEEFMNKTLDAFKDYVSKAKK